jgi:hypothetical protein
MVSTLAGVSFISIRPSCLTCPLSRILLCPRIRSSKAVLYSSLSLAWFKFCPGEVFHPDLLGRGVPIFIGTEGEVAAASFANLPPVSVAHPHATKFISLITMRKAALALIVAFKAGLFLSLAIPPAFLLNMIPISALIFSLKYFTCITIASVFVIPISHLFPPEFNIRYAYLHISVVNIVFFLLFCWVLMNAFSS